MFWRHKDRLLRADRSDLECLVASLVTLAPQKQRHEHLFNPPSLLGHVRGRLLVGMVSDLPRRLPPYLPGSGDKIAYVLISEHMKVDAGDDANGDADPLVSDVLTLDLPLGKRGQAQFLDTVLPFAIPFIDMHLSQGASVCICCDTGKDASVGVALAASQMFFDDGGEYVTAERRGRLMFPRYPAHTDNGNIATLARPDKQSISTRLQWIIMSRAQANPSRATLKRVNEFLMTPPSLRRRVTTGAAKQSSVESV